MTNLERNQLNFINLRFAAKIEFAEFSRTVEVGSHFCPGGIIFAIVFHITAEIKAGTEIGFCRIGDRDFSNPLSGGMFDLTFPVCLPGFFYVTVIKPVTICPDCDLIISSAIGTGVNKNLNVFYGRPLAVPVGERGEHEPQHRVYDERKRKRGSAPDRNRHDRGESARQVQSLQHLLARRRRALEPREDRRREDTCRRRAHHPRHRRKDDHVAERHEVFEKRTRRIVPCVRVLE